MSPVVRLPPAMRTSRASRVQAAATGSWLSKADIVKAPVLERSKDKGAIKVATSELEPMQVTSKRCATTSQAARDATKPESALRMPATRLMGSLAWHAQAECVALELQWAESSSVQGVDTPWLSWPPAGAESAEGLAARRR